jgi:hypothetical protein
MTGPRHAARQSSLMTWWQRTPARRRGWELLLLPITVGLVVGSTGPAVSSRLESHSGHRLEIISDRAYGELGSQKIDVVMRNSADTASAVTRVTLTFVGFECPPAPEAAPRGPTYPPDNEPTIPSSRGSIYNVPPELGFGVSLPPVLTSATPLTFSMTEKVPAHDLDRFQLSLYMIERRLPVDSHPSCPEEKAHFKLMAYHDGVDSPIVGPYVGVKIDRYYQGLRTQKPTK